MVGTKKNWVERAHHELVKTDRWAFVCWRCFGVRSKAEAACCTNADDGISCYECCALKGHQTPLDWASAGVKALRS